MESVSLFREKKIANVATEYKLQTTGWFPSEFKENWAA